MFGWSSDEDESEKKSATSSPRAKQPRLEGGTSSGLAHGRQAGKGNGAAQQTAHHQGNTVSAGSGAQQSAHKVEDERGGSLAAAQRGSASSRDIFKSRQEQQTRLQDEKITAPTPEIHSPDDYSDDLAAGLGDGPTTFGTTGSANTESANTGSTNIKTHHSTKTTSTSSNINTTSSGGEVLVERDAAASKGKTTNTNDPFAHVELPPTPPGSPDPGLTARMERFMDLKARGKHLNDAIEASVDYQNPYILEKVIKLFDIDEYCTNFPPEQFDPSLYLQISGGGGGGS
ncbi:unnamed protein product [Amoebophrya sp. A25]|nr:unnamed protein product [Amoebophrya sp. A25]|eukprot:GSA25T00023819001.1